MYETVLGTITNFVEAFTPNPITPLGSKVKLDDPFIAAFDLLHKITDDKKDALIKQALYFYAEERHYSHNISTLLYYFLYYLKNYREDEHVQWDFGSRLTLDIEQLLTNVRSFLDSTYQIALLFSNDRSGIPNRRQKSFGKFAEWAIQCNDKHFDRPLGFMSEVVPWGLTIRTIRDDYIHRGREAWPLWGADDAFFYPYLSHRKVSRMPDRFYRSESRSRTEDEMNSPIYVRKFIVYAVVPVFAIEQVLGRYLYNFFTSTFGPEPLHEFGFPFSADPNIQALYELVCQNLECLDREIYEATYFTSAPINH
jgi:hypothetical protein